jgi:hypothetical protein
VENLNMLSGGTMVDKEGRKQSTEKQVPWSNGDTDADDDVGGPPMAAKNEKVTVTDGSWRACI